MGYEVSFTRSAEKDLRRIGRGDPGLRRRLVAAAQALATNPRPDGCKKLSGIAGYRIRVREYRILYTIDDGVVTVRVFRFASRAEAYE
ncbi:type II toxin-antitoxin system RelE family toxin [Tsukamurella pseudospumae]|uniref:Plasmid stabilization protein n=1 Tax=Tsukamurella pseudospumae TaxID=239498 RepID=A0A137YZH0_9ACTN|nr:type II toxin-antitoxin system RelE/ParE family toxin [Tsukamurella pseudospumae]KXO91273.1 plasmid stabilization protein [Tsukamurella pseudospumae]